MKCSDCKHWEVKADEFSSLKDDIRTCFKAKQLWDCTEWIEDESKADERYFDRQLKAEFADLLRSF